MRTVQLELLRPGEILEEQKRISLVYVPMGPIEWHSYHMPMGTDVLIAQETARRLAQKTGGVVAPTLYAGTERNDSRQMLQNLGIPHDENSYIVGMDFPANPLPSMYMHEEVFAVVVREHLRLLVKMGFRLIVIVNRHGAAGQVSTLRRLCEDICHDYGVHCIYPEFGGKRSAAVARKAKLHSGHADIAETALMMALTDSVDVSQLPASNIPLHSADFGIASGPQFMGRAPKDGLVIDDPRTATAELGEELIAADVDDTAEYVLAYYRDRVEGGAVKA
jgi:creatinine amidohydrolase